MNNPENKLNKHCFNVHTARMAVFGSNIFIKKREFELVNPISLILCVDSDDERHREHYMKREWKHK